MSNTLDELLSESEEQGSRPIVGWFYRKGFYHKNLAYWLKEPWSLGH